MKASLHVKSSSGDSYQVDFTAEGGAVKIRCYCQAGILNQICKHKLALINGDMSVVSDSESAGTLSRIHLWPEFAKVVSRTRQYEASLGALATTRAELAAKEKSIKAEFAHDLSAGIRD